MPLVEYSCARCGAVIEVIQRHGQADQARCGEDCALGYDGDGAITRRLSTFGGHIDGQAARARSSLESTQAASCGTCGGAPGSCEG
ncbi:zinc ribbon domain-containing protein [Myxococcota bacterium]|nr:zinc ribbon domain-containing protein [Myxococcota bacterium]